MTPDETGRFCDSCSKTVIDFTSLSDEEVLAVFQKSATKVCGRFTASQLDRNLLLQKQHQNTLLPAVMISSALVAGVAPSAIARPENITVQPLMAETETDRSAGPQQPAAKADTLPAIRGKVFGPDSLPIIAVSVRIKGTNYATLTDADGNFQLTIPDSLNKKEDIKLEFASIGYNTQNLCIPGSANSQVYIEQQLQLSVSGEVEIVYVGAVQKRTFWQRLKRLFR